MEPENRSIIWKLNDEILIISILIIVTLITLLLTIFTNIFVLSFIFYPATILPIFYLNRRKHNMDFKLSLISLGFINPSKYTQFKSFFFNSIYPYLLALSYWAIGLLFVGICYYFINYFWSFNPKFICFYQLNYISFFYISSIRRCTWILGEQFGRWIRTRGQVPRIFGFLTLLFYNGSLCLKK